VATEIEDILSLEAVYFSAPVPHNLAVLTVLGAIFDKVHFPGVWMPKTGYDLIEVQKEIERLEALPPGPSRHHRGMLIGTMKFLKYRETLEGFCEFTATDEDPYGKKHPIPQAMVEGIYEAIHGPPRPNFIPMFSTGHTKGLPGGEESIIYPGTYHYLAGAITHSAQPAFRSSTIFPICRSPHFPSWRQQTTAYVAAALDFVWIFPETTPLWLVWHRFGMAVILGYYSCGSQDARTLGHTSGSSSKDNSS
jgi:hypothetical protein